MSEITYPLDTSGNAPTNLIANEIHTTTEANFRDYHFVIPNFAPFYVDNFKLVYHHSGIDRVLDEGVDYVFALPYVAGVRSIGKPMYGAISFNNLDVNGIIKLTYQTLGGEWIADKLHVLTRMTEMVYNPRTTIWDMVTDKPDIFPPIPHYNDYDDFYGQEQVVTSLNEIRDAILQGKSGPGDYDSDYTEYNNPNNWAVATRNEVARLESKNKLLTPYNIKPTIERLDDGVLEAVQKSTAAINTVEEHVTNFDNPHQVDAADIGLDNVDNTRDADKNVATAALLTTQRLIAGVPFNGGSDIDIPFANLTDKPSTLAGYGITDAISADHIGKGGAEHALATPTEHGFMSSDDKTKLDGLVSGDLGYEHPVGDGNLHVPPTSYSNAGRALFAGSTPGALYWGSVASLGNTAGMPPGTPDPGTSSFAARADHVHAPPVNITGNSGTTDKFKTPVMINGQSFDGSEDITITAVDPIPRIAVAEKGAINGVASLDGDGKVPLTQLPDPKQEVQGYTTAASFPASGDLDTLYYAFDTEKIYYWNGATYKIFTSGNVNSVNAMEGDVVIDKAAIGLSEVDNTADADKNVASAATLTTARKIAGVLFKGDADIDIPYANLYGAPGLVTDTTDGLMSKADKVKLDAINGDGGTGMAALMYLKMM